MDDAQETPCVEDVCAPHGTSNGTLQAPPAITQPRASSQAHQVLALTTSQMRHVYPLNRRVYGTSSFAGSRRDWRACRLMGR